MIFFWVLHFLICGLLLTVILMQSGRGGGLTDTFAAAESMFGAKTNEFMVKVTTVLAVLFLASSLNLAYFSAKKDRSLMDRIGSLPKIDLTKPSAKKGVTPSTNKSVEPVSTTDSSDEAPAAVPAPSSPDKSAPVPSGAPVPKTATETK